MVNVDYSIWVLMWDVLKSWNTYTLKLRLSLASNAKTSQSKGYFFYLFKL